MESQNGIRFFEVGGAIRDELLGIPSKDVDFAVEATSFQDLHDFLLLAGFKVWEVREEFLTIRAGVPKDHPLAKRTKDADFVMCRADGPSSDARRPDFVTPGTLLDDLKRRDFTVNAIARDPETGEFIDPHNGMIDLGLRVLEFVGEPMDRVREDGLRILRGFRFMVTKGLTPGQETARALLCGESAELLSTIPTERVEMELRKMFQFNTLTTLDLLATLPEATKQAIFRDGLKLNPTTKQRLS